MSLSRASAHFALVFALVAVFLFLPGSASPAHATTVSTEGTEFYVTFDDHYTGAGGAPAQRLLYLSSRDSGTASITWPNGTTNSYSLAANAITTVDATLKGIGTTGLGYGYLGTSRRSALISSSVPISVYGASVDPGTSDAFVAIPTASLGLSYRVVSFEDTFYQQISVIATQPGTTVVTVTPSVNFIPAPSRTAGTPYTVTLQQGEVYSVTTADGLGSDISGTQVSADKKIVVTSSLSSATLGGGTGDHLVEYMPPITSWGSSFLLPGSLNTVQPDIYPIVADADGTVVTINGSAVATLNAGQRYLHTGQPSSGVQLVDVVQTSKPVLIGQGYRSGRVAPSGPHGYAGQSGDPAFSLVTPTAQFLRQYTLATPASGFAVNSLTLLTLTSSVSSLRLNGAPIADGSFIPVAGSDYSVARIVVPAGNYLLSGNSGVGVYVSGFNEANSYAYPGGFALIDLVQNPGGVDALLSVGDSGSGGGSAGQALTVAAEPELAATGVQSASAPLWALSSVLLGLALLLFRLRSRRTA